MEEQTGKIFLAVFLAILLGGAILLYLIPMVQEEREEQQKEKDEWNKVVQDALKRRTTYHEEEKRYNDVMSRIEDIEIRANNRINRYGFLYVHVTFLDSDGENINFDFKPYKLCYDVEINNSAQERIVLKSDCISRSDAGTTVDIKNLPEDGTLKVSCWTTWDSESWYGKIEKEIKIKDIPIPTPFIPTPTPNTNRAGF